MKFKQKKLKAENFRYVTKEIIKNPMIYLDDFFRSQTRIRYWLREINLLINSATYSDMSSPVLMENGYHCRQLIKQVEVAYIIYKQCGLKKQKKPLEFFKTRKDYFFFTFEGEVTFNGKANPADAISKFFSFQSLADWYRTLDDMMLYLADPMDTSDERFGDRIVPIRELLLRLGQALYTIYEEDGLSIRVPSYVIVRPTPISTKLSDDLLDEEADPDDEETDESEALLDDPEVTGDASFDASTEVEIENHQIEGR